MRRMRLAHVATAQEQRRMDKEKKQGGTGRRKHTRRDENREGRGEKTDRQTQREIQRQKVTKRYTEREREREREISADPEGVTACGGCVV